MNIYKRIFCVLLVFVYLCVVFLPLHTVYATENDIMTLNLDDDDYGSGNILISTHIYNGYTWGAKLLNDVIMDHTIHTNADATANISAFDFNKFLEQRLLFKSVDKSKMFSKNSKVTLELSGFNVSLMVNDGDWYSILYRNANLPVSSNLYVLDAGGNYVSTSGSVTISKGANGQIVLNFTIDSLPCDAYGVWVGFRFYFNDVFGYMPSSDTKVSIKNGFTNALCSFTETEDDGTKGLLGSIIQLVTNIKDGVINLPSKIASSIKGFFDNVVSAVTNIGSLIKNAIVDLGNFLIDGIKSLFVPSEEDITQMQDKWDELLSDRFGALYQTTELISDYASAFTNQQKNTITMPSVTIPLAGSDFVFGGWEVQVVPDGFSVVFDTLKLIISIVCTVWFVNGLKNRFERLVGGANNI